LGLRAPHYCDYGVLVTRSDFSAKKHDGLTYFFLDMKSPGIEIRPIKQMSGASHFNQVFFKDVRVPDSQRLGAVGQGWKVALTTLMNERYTIGGRMGAGVEDVFELARRLEIGDGPALKNGAVRDKLADWYVASQGLKYANFRAMTALSRGETPGPEASLGKLVNASMLQTIAAFAMDLMEEGGVLCDPELAPLAAAFSADAIDFARLAHRRRLRRDHAQHHRRARAGLACRGPPRQDLTVQSAADRQAVSAFGSTPVA
jgi:alkylation response protein AidB-like acyl-CoA dehydrogenase